MLPYSYRPGQAHGHAGDSRNYAPRKAKPMTAAEEPPDFTQLDDTALLAAREQIREQLQRLPPHSPGHAALTARYDAGLDELVERARKAWTSPAKEDRWTT
jgi:hypothetical protein